MPDRAIFLDRDGVINRRRDEHVRSWSEFEFLPGVLHALGVLRARQRRTVVVTNQSVVGRGLISSAELASIHHKMMTAVDAAGGRIERVYACPHAPWDRCGCRKPAITMLVRAAQELGFDLRHSVFVGDSDCDVEAALTAGCRPILVGDPELDAKDGVPVVPGLLEALGLLERLSEKDAVC